MKILIAVFVITSLAFVLLSAPSFAQKPDLNSGNAILQNCQAALNESPSDFLGAGYCYGYLDGLAEGESIKMLPPPELSQTRYGPEWKQWCEPTGVTTGQRVRVVVKYLTEHPDRLHEEKLLQVRQAFEQAWACFKK